MIINYPNKKKILKKDINFNRRGMNFEEMINITNKYYLSQDIACIYKKPTPIQVVKVDYKKRSSCKITEAYYSKPSTTDYNGIYKGKYIDFEAKQTNLSYFPLQNIYTHQIEHMEKIRKHGGISFLLLYFKKLNKIYFLESKYIFDYYKCKKKKIDISCLEENGFTMIPNSCPLVDYINIINNFILKEFKFEKEK